MSSAGGRGAHAFTLLELLIVIALLLAIAAVAIPSLVRDLDDRAFDAAVETVVGHLLLARAHAQANAVAVEVRYRSDPARVEARVFDPSRGGVSEDGAFLDDEPDDAPPIIAEAWAFRTLPRDVRITRIPPSDPASGPGRWAGFDEPADAEESIRLVVYLPDGSALLRSTAWFVDEPETRRVRLEVSGFTGVPSLTAVDPDAEPEPREGEPDADPAAPRDAGMRSGAGGPP